MMLKATYRCMRCLVDQATHAVELAVQDPRERLAIMTGVLHLLKEFYPGRVPAELGTRVHAYVMERSGKDPYADLKRKSNEKALEVAERFRQRNPSFRDLVLAAVAGNAVDFGVDGSRDALRTLREELGRGLTLDHFRRFAQEVEKAERVLYLTDNCGEIVFDGLLIRHLVEMGKRVTVSPKEEPILNDATAADLRALGFDRMARIVPHTRNAIGLLLAEVSEAFRKEWEAADLVVAKGMGHFETLYGTDKNLVFLLKAKCVPVAESLGVEVGAHVLTF